MCVHEKYAAKLSLCLGTPGSHPTVPQLPESWILSCFQNMGDFLGSF